MKNILSQLKIMNIRTLLIFFLFNLWLCVYLSAQNITSKAFNLSSYHPNANGVTDDTPSFMKLFQEVEKAHGGTVTIPPGDYFLKGKISLPLPSNTTIFAYGAKIYLPEVLDDRSQIIVFLATDISNFSWFGGYFKGYCYDPNTQDNSWEPNVNTRIFVINTSEEGKTDKVTFRDITSDKISGSIINVNGYSKEPDFKNANFATNVSIENCTLINSGKFMWDYGFLWQIIVFSKEYNNDALKMAHKYFDTSLIFKNIKISDADTHVYLKNIDEKVRAEKHIKEGQEVCFYNDILPENIVLGKRYYVVESMYNYIKISDSINGNPIIFKGSGGPEISLINNLRKAFFQYAPLGSGPGKGSIDLVVCKNTKITGCRISALGDAMHLQKCHDNVFANNHILGARMGAFFLAEYCMNSLIIGNIVDGTNGSRTVSIEKSNENVTVIGNIFKNGGRGCWINQPKNIIIQNNVFINNTTKGERNKLRGRRDPKTGGWQSFPEIYFTTYEENGQYGPVILSDNIFITGSNAAAAIQFEKNGFDIQVDGNVFKGTTGVIMLDEDDNSIIIRNNHGEVVKKGKEYSRAQFNNSF